MPLRTRTMVELREEVVLCVQSGLGIAEAAAREGGVIRKFECGYPHRYLARAVDVLATIRDRVPYKAPMYEHPSWVVPEGSVLLPGYVGKTTIEDKSIDECSADEWLYIEVWDES